MDAKRVFCRYCHAITDQSFRYKARYHDVYKCNQCDCRNAVHRQSGAVEVGCGVLRSKTR